MRTLRKGIIAAALVGIAWVGAPKQAEAQYGVLTCFTAISICQVSLPGVFIPIGDPYCAFNFNTLRANWYLDYNCCVDAPEGLWCSGVNPCVYDDDYCDEGTVPV